KITKDLLLIPDSYEFNRAIDEYNQMAPPEFQINAYTYHSDGKVSNELYADRYVEDNQLPLSREIEALHDFSYHLAWIFYPQAFSDFMRSAVRAQRDFTSYAKGISFKDTSKEALNKLLSNITAASAVDI